MSIVVRTYFLNWHAYTVLCSSQMSTGIKTNEENHKGKGKKKDFFTHTQAFPFLTFSSSLIHQNSCFVNCTECFFLFILFFFLFRCTYFCSSGSSCSTGSPVAMQSTSYLKYCSVSLLLGYLRCWWVFGITRSMRIPCLPIRCCIEVESMGKYVT